MKEPGKCTVCGCECFEIRDIYHQGPLQGQPRQLGAPMGFAYRVTLILIDGSQMPITTCADCKDMTETDIVKSWHAIKERYRFERQHWAAFGARRFTPAQNAAADTFQRELFDNVPLGAYVTQLWSDVDA